MNEENTKDVTIPEADWQHRQNIAVHILAGFCANPNVFVRKAEGEWALNHITEKELVGYSLYLANELLTAQHYSIRSESP